MSEKKWFGAFPVNCDFCKKSLEKTEYFVDGKTHYGPWAMMCPSCYNQHGCGLGTGRGQKYDSTSLVKLEG